MLAAVAVTLIWAATVWAAPHIEVASAVHRLALFCHLAALVVGFGAVLTVDWLGLKWMLRRIDLSALLRTAHDTHLLIWLGLAGLAATGVLLSPDTSAPLTRLKLVAVLIVALNGLYVGRLHGQLAGCTGGPPTRLLLRGAAAALTSQACWWTATTVGFRPASSGNTGRVDISELVLRDGDLVRASGRVVVDGDEVWFEPPLPMTLVHYSSKPPAPRPSGLGVRAVGVDLDALDEGWASLSGAWQNDRLVVRGQGNIGPDSRRDLGPGFRREEPRGTRPPCPPPPGGWPYGEPDEDIDVPPDLVSAYPITSLARSGPVPGSASWWSPPRSPSRSTPTCAPGTAIASASSAADGPGAEVDDLLHRLREGMSQWMVYECGETVAEDGQPLVTANVSRVLPAFASSVRAVPDGLLSLSSWLAPRSAPR